MSTACPTDDIVASYVQGLLSPDDRAHTDAHLDGCSECRSLISELARSTRSPEVEVASESMPGIGPGVIVAGKYEIVEEIATGGMGIVYLAHQASLDRMVALKLMRVSVAGSVEAALRFTREAKIAAQLASPHIVNVLDVGLTDAGLPFIVMEHLKGVDLENHIASSKQLPINEAIDLVRQICRGLHEAHSQGIVHRDLKPSNVFLVPESQGGTRAVLLDFGVSKTSHSDMSLTQTGTVMGSPRYMAPEQLADSKNVDHRADIWSLGVILYELLAGMPPYKSTTLVPLVAEILQGTPTPIRELRPELSESQAAVVNRCLQRDPGDRFEDADALSRALVGMHQSRFAATRIALPMPAAPLALTRTRFVVPALLGSALTGALLLSVFLIFQRPSQDERAAEQEPAATEHVIDPDPPVPAALPLLPAATSAKEASLGAGKAVDAAEPEARTEEFSEPRRKHRDPKTSKASHRAGQADAPAREEDEDALLDLPL